MPEQLRVGLVGDGASRAATQLQALNTGGGVVLVERPGVLAECQLVIGSGPVTDEPDADVWCDDAEALDEVWRNRVVPFAENLAAGRRARRMQRAVLCDPDPTWPAQAQRLIARLRAAVGERAIRIDHIGSTSVPELPAKNLVDIQVVVADLEVADEVAAGARRAGFVRVGLQWCADQRGVEHPEVVVVDADPGRPVNVNIRAVTDPIWRETLRFRNWLRVQPAARAEYLAMKRALAARPDHDVNDYGVDKIPWISAAAARAETWAEETGSQP